LKLIHSYADYRPWRFDELSSKIKDDETDIGVTRPMIERLVEDGYLRKIHPKGPSSYIIRTRDEEIVNGQDLDKTVGDELRRLIGFLESSDTAITVAADVLGTARNLEDVKSELTSGPIFNRIDKLGTVVDRLKDDPQVNIEQQDLGKIIIRNQTATYQVTPTGERPFALFRIQQAKSALRHESYIQTTVQVSQALENFLTCLLFNHDPSLDDSEYQSFYHLIDRIGKNDLMSAIDVEKIEDLRRIRNELVHTNTDQSIPEHFENIQEESNFVISDFDEMIETAEEIIDSYSG
jgi:HEPN domain-containing protein